MNTLKDKALEELFLAQKPHFTDSAAFMERLDRRLDAVESIRQQQEVTLRRYKMAVVVAFAVGIVSGAVSMALVLNMPDFAINPDNVLIHQTEVPLFLLKIQTGLLLWIAENFRIIAAMALSLLMTLGTISIIGNVREILHMQTQLRAARK